MIFGTNALHNSIRPDNVESRPTNPKRSLISKKSITAQTIPMMARDAVAITRKKERWRASATNHVRHSRMGTARLEVAERAAMIMHTQSAAEMLYAHR